MLLQGIIFSLMFILNKLWHIIFAICKSMVFWVYTEKIYVQTLREYVIGNSVIVLIAADSTASTNIDN